MSQNTERYEIFCRNKIRALETYLRRYKKEDALVQSISRFAVANIYLWAAESIYGIEGTTDRFSDFCRRAAELDPTSRRLENLRRIVEYERVQAEYQHVHTEYEHTHAEYERVQAEYERVRAEYDRLHPEFQTIQNNFEALRKERDQLRSRLQAIENSKGRRLVLKYRSWRDRLKRVLRMTGPDTKTRPLGED